MKRQINFWEPITFFSLFLFFFISGVCAQDPIQHTLRFPSPHNHYVEIETLIPTKGHKEIEMMMAVWTPGSYLVREFSKNVENVSFKNLQGKVLPFKKKQKNRWFVLTQNEAQVLVSYRVYAREMSVRTSWVEQDFALLNGGSIFMTLVEKLSRPHKVQLILPPAWKHSATGLKKFSTETTHCYLAESFDQLVDCPIVLGNPAIYSFKLEDKTHYLVNVGEEGVWDGPRSLRDLEKVVQAHHKFWGHLPYEEQYLFLNLLTESRGGLEHRNSTVLMTSRWNTKNAKSYKDWLNLVSHEFFHTWNVKRLRPKKLGPFDYENEVYTDDLWIVEGLTSYYSGLLLARAKLISRLEYLSWLARDINTLQNTPGRKVQSLNMSSFDTWIKFYRKNENSKNCTISYYNKGAIVGFLLDAKIRKQTQNKKSLDDVMRLAYQKYSGKKGFTSQEFQEVVFEVAGVEFKEWFYQVLYTTRELDYTEALDWFGLEFSTGVAGRKKWSPAWLGVGTKKENGRLVITEIRRGTPGYKAGLNVEDEIIGINNFRIYPDRMAAMLSLYRPQDKVKFLISRRGKLEEIEVILGKKTSQQWLLRGKRNASKFQKKSLNQWLGY